jgi:hypothetical protein
VLVLSFFLDGVVNVGIFFSYMVFFCIGVIVFLACYYYFLMFVLKYLLAQSLLLLFLH